MDIIKTSINNPIAVASGVILAIVFGMLAFARVPIQLAPDIERPVISIRTDWGGAAPEEIEREIITKQEDVLKGLENLESMTSQARPNSARVRLEFSVGSDMGRMLLLTSNNLDRVGDYPSDVSQPRLSVSSAEDNAIAWFRLLQKHDNDGPIFTYGTLAEDVIKTKLERVAGVGGVNIFGGTQRQLQIIIDPFRLARFGLSVSDVVQALKNADIAVSAGNIDEGKRRYTVRLDNQFNTIERIENVVLRSLDGSSSGGKSYVLLGDISDVGFGYSKPSARIRSNGFESIAINVTRQTGANVIETMEGIRKTVELLNRVELDRAGLQLEQVYDETVYIKSSIGLVTQNIWIGGLLAIFILLLFLRSWLATLVVVTAIPVSVVVSFVAMVFFGRSLNVISLAGIAFAVGMVVDAAIVVLENIFRLRSKGMPALQAAHEGALQVWGAILVSTLTTVMVFIPILVMELEVGQLFRDIAVAISVSVLASMLVGLTLIPTLSGRLFEHISKKPLSIRRLDHTAVVFVGWVTNCIQVFCKRQKLALGTVCGLLVLSCLMTWQLLPKLEYLPNGNRNFVFGVIFPPAGYNLETMQAIGDEVDNALLPLLHHSNKAIANQKPSNGSIDLEIDIESSLNSSSKDRQPNGKTKIKDYFFVNTAASAFIGASAQEAEKASALIPVLRGAISQEPGIFGFFSQPSLFGRGIGGTRSIDLDISGPDLGQIAQASQIVFGQIAGVLPFQEGNQVRPRPGLEIGEPEIRMIPDTKILFDNGLSVQDYAQTIDAYNDGVRVKEISIGGKLIDLVLKGSTVRIGDQQEDANEVSSIPIVTKAGKVLPASSFASIGVTVGPSQIRRVEGARTITLQISPRDGIALEQAMQILQEEVIGKAYQSGHIDPAITMDLTGTASKLDETWQRMRFDLAIALLIVYFVMASLFSSFIYPLVVIVSVPIAAGGGVLGLALLNLKQFNPLDMLTLLGFIILIGIVVNNAILIVHQTLYNLRKSGMLFEEAIVEATQNRIRPIFMSTLTSVFGMLPLVLFPGAGSEIYRGLGSVVIGGLALSALLTLILVPALLVLIRPLLEKERKLYHNV